MAADVHDIAIVRLNGVDHRTKQGATLRLGGFNRTSQYASGRRTGSAREPMASRFEGSFELMADTDVAAIRNFEGDCDYITSTNQLFRCARSQLMEPPTISDNGQGIAVVIEGDAAEEA